MRKHVFAIADGQFNVYYKLVFYEKEGMFIVTDEHLFERGVIEAKIASCNHNYSESIVMSVLTWIGENFFEEERLEMPGVRRYDV